MTTRQLYPVITAFAAVTLIAAAPLRESLTLQPESRIWVSGKSTVKDFRCEAKTIDADIKAPAARTTDLDITKLVSAADVTIAVTALECGNSTMNEHMRKALKSSANPSVAFKLISYGIKGDTITLNGTLTLAGQDRAVDLKGIVSESKGIIRTSATRVINMTEWGVKPPSLMMGTMKVKPLATIGYDISIKR